MVPPVHSNFSRNTDAPLNDLAPHGQNLNLLVRKSGQTAMNIGQNMIAAILVMDEGPLRQTTEAPAHWYVVDVVVSPKSKAFRPCTEQQMSEDTHARAHINI